MPAKRPDLTLLDDVVSPKVLEAMRVASARLAGLGVRHLLVGGLAVGAHGHPRATKDVDFLVSDDAFEEHGGGVVTMKYGVPVQVGGVVVDHLSAQAPEDHLRELLRATPIAELAVAPAAVLMYLKLKSPRPKDRLDVLELIRAGIDMRECREYLGKNAPDLLSRLDECEKEAWAGEDD